MLPGFEDTADQSDYLTLYHADSLHKLIADSGVILRIARLEAGLAERFGNTVQAQDGVKSFLVDACCACSPKVLAHASITAATRSDKVRELGALSASIAALAQKISAHAAGHKHSTSLKYLMDRLQAGNPVGFNSHRTGWKARNYATHSSPTLEDRNVSMTLRHPGTLI